MFSPFSWFRHLAADYPHQLPRQFCRANEEMLASRPKGVQRQTPDYWAALYIWMFVSHSEFVRLQERPPFKQVLLTLENMANDSRLPEQCNSFLHNKDQWRYTHKVSVLCLISLLLTADGGTKSLALQDSALWVIKLWGEVECATLRSTRVYNKPVWKASI